MENNTFTYSYSAARNKEVEDIRRKYIPHEESKLERLKRLDRKVQSAGTVEGLCFGIIGALLMIPAYPIYRRISSKTRAELTPEILSLSEEIIRSANN